MIQRAFPAKLATFALLGTVLATVSARTEPLAERPFVPVVRGEDGPALDGETWFQEGPGYALQLTRLDEAARGEYLRVTTGLDTDPFVAVTGDTNNFTTFLVQIKNRAAADLAFNPLNCWMKCPGGMIYTPLGLADMNMAFHSHGVELPEEYERSSAALLDAPTRLEGEDALHGLMVYRGPGPRARSFEVHVELVLGNGEVVRMVASYARAKKQKKQKEGDER